MIKVAVDAMGGDYAPSQMVAGAIAAANLRKDIQVVLVGRKEDVEKELSGKDYPHDRIQIAHASEVIATEEPPVNAIRKKRTLLL